MSEEEKIKLFEQFIDESDLWKFFEEFVIGQGYKFEDIMI